MLRDVAVGPDLIPRESIGTRQSGDVTSSRGLFSESPPQPLLDAADVRRVEQRGHSDRRFLVSTWDLSETIRCMMLHVVGSCF